MHYHHIYKFYTSLPGVSYPRYRHTTAEDFSSHESSQTVPQRLFRHTSNRPSVSTLPPTSRTSPLLQTTVSDETNRVGQNTPTVLFLSEHCTLVGVKLQLLPLQDVARLKVGCDSSMDCWKICPRVMMRPDVSKPWLRQTASASALPKSLAQTAPHVPSTQTSMRPLKSDTPPVSRTEPWVQRAIRVYMEECHHMNEKEGTLTQTQSDL